MLRLPPPCATRALGLFVRKGGEARLQRCPARRLHRQSNFRRKIGPTTSVVTSRQLSRASTYVRRAAYERPARVGSRHADCLSFAVRTARLLSNSSHRWGNCTPNCFWRALWHCLWRSCMLKKTSLAALALLLLAVIARA